MDTYALEIGMIMISIAKSNKPVPQALDYLIRQYILSLGKYIKHLLIDSKYRLNSRYNKLHQFLNHVQHYYFFSNFSQQREVAFALWYQIMVQHADRLTFTPLQFLKENSDPSRGYLFKNN